VEIHSTVTLFARSRGLSTLHPRATAAGENLFDTGPPMIESLFAAGLQQLSKILKISPVRQTQRLLTLRFQQNYLVIDSTAMEI
jgi:hypothetical protein